MEWEWPLVGRDAERARIAGLLRARMRDGSPAPDEPVGPTGILLHGDGGVGKTRLAAETMAAAEAMGYRTVRATATRASHRITLGAMAPLLPELGDQTVNLLVAARESLAARAGSQPLLLFVDDAHLLDDASSSLLLQLATEGQIFVLATVRTGHQLSDAITTLWKDGYVERIDVDPLGSDAVDALIDGSLDGPVDPQARRELRRISAGNPLALRELMRGAVEGGALVAEDGMWRLRGPVPVSARLADLAEERLGSLTDEQLSVLEFVALGEPVDVAALEALVDQPSLEAVERRGLIVVRQEGERLEAWLAHPLHGEVVRARTGGLRTRNVLRSLADAVSAQAQPRRGDTLRIATWRLDAGTSTDPDQLVVAARQAFVAMDIELARRLSGAAWQVRPSVAAGHMLGHVLCDLGRFDEAEVVLAAAEELAADDHERVLVTMSRTENLFRMNRLDEAMAVNEAAEAAVTDPECRDELVGHRATFVLLSGRPGDAYDLVAPLLAGDAVRPRVQAAIAGGIALGYDGRPDDAHALHERAWNEAQVVWGSELLQSDPGIHAVGMISALVVGGRLSEARQLLDIAWEISNQQRASSSLAWFALFYGNLTSVTGELESALSWYRISTEHFRVTGQMSRLRWTYAGEATAAASLGLLVEARQALEHLDGLPVAPGLNVGLEEAARAWIASAQGQPQAARDVLDAAADQAIAVRNRTVAVMVLHDLARLGDAERAVGRVDDLAGHLQGALLHGRAEHVRALAAGDGDALAAASATFEAMGAFLFAAEAAADAARALRRVGHGREATSAANAARRLTARCEGAQTPALALAETSAALTRREREVALLAAQGHSSRAIAERLVLSVRTVDNHLARTYEKLGINSRDELRALSGSLAGDQ